MQAVASPGVNQSQDWFDQQGVLPTVRQPTFTNTTGANAPPPTWTPGQAYSPAGNVPAPGSPNATVVPSYVNVNDPTQKLVWQGFAGKGITPRDQSDFQYWVDHVNSSGGAADAGNASYWTNRLAQAQGGAGDYQERPEQGTTATAASPMASYTAPTYTLPSMADLEKTPGYQFTKQQGENAIQTAAVAKGLSGGTLKDLDTFNTGLADQTYQNAVGNSLNAFGANTGAGQFGANYNLAANNQGFQQGLATNQFNLGAQNQFWGQGLAQNQNAFNQYNTNQNTAFNQWLQTAQLGNPGNPFA